MNYKEFERLRFLKNYKRDVMKFAIVNLFCISILIIGYFLNIFFIDYWWSGIVFFVSLVLICYFITFKLRFRRIELSIASIFVFVYMVSPNVVFEFIIQMVVSFSLFYNILLKFFLGIKLIVVPRDTKWASIGWGR